MALVAEQNKQSTYNPCISQDTQGLSEPTARMFKLLREHTRHAKVQVANLPVARQKHLPLH